MLDYHKIDSPNNKAYPSTCLSVRRSFVIKEFIMYRTSKLWLKIFNPWQQTTSSVYLFICLSVICY